MSDTKKLPAALTAVTAKLNKEFGDGTIVLGSQINHSLVPRATTGSFSLDVAMGGGWAANQWNEIVGEESAGKTALVMKTIAANQKRDPNWIVVWVAGEFFVPSYAKMLGVDLDRVITVDTNIMEDAYDVTLEYLRSQEVDCVVIDSLPALSPDPENDADMDENTMALGARLTNKFFRKVHEPMKRSLIDPTARPVMGLLINQWRDKIGVMYGDPRTTPGGKGKNYEFFIRVEVARGDWIEDDTKKERLTVRKKSTTKSVKVGQELRCRIFKNKTAPSGRTAIVDYYFEDGTVDGQSFNAGDFDRVKEVVAVARQMEIINGGGGGIFTYDAQKWKGMNQVVEAFKEDPVLLASVESDIMGVVMRGKV